MSGKRQPQNPVIGHWQCTEGGKAEVRQAAKRGRHFYTQCECCGVQMGTGAARQTKIWNEAEFLPGVNVIKPGNVTDEGQGESLPAVREAAEPKPEPAKGGDGEAGGRWKPGMGEPEETETETEQPSGNRGPLVALGVALAALGAGVWMS